jgi:glutamyl-tRNA synthetase
MKVRTRFAPSPTGFMHIGNLRTALYCYAIAHRTGGTYVLRIEDTDQDRYVEGAVDEIFDMLSAFSLEPDESSRHGGNYGPYIQSERKELYQKYARELVEKGAAYYCFLTEEEVENIKKENQATRRPFRSPYRDKSIAEADKLISEGRAYVVRQKLESNRVISYTDGVQGEMEFNTDNVDEGVLLKTSGLPTYHLAVVVDDHLMEITHVFRGAEWLPSTPKHILLHEALGWDMPKIFHVTAILDHQEVSYLEIGNVFARQFLKDGYLPEAILNLLMLLGWSSPEERTYGTAEREIYSLSDFVSLFDVKDLNKSNPVFNRDKLLWFNKRYIAGMSATELSDRFLDWMSTYNSYDELVRFIEADNEQGLLDNKLELVKERANLLSEVLSSISFFYTRPSSIDWGIKQLDKVGSQLDLIRKDIHDFLETLPADSNTWEHDEWEMGLRAIGDKYGAKHGDIFMVLRVAITGGPFSPPLFEALQILGKSEVLARLEY